MKYLAKIKLVCRNEKSTYNEVLLLTGLSIKFT
nr:MAG TPA_asm: hypothetical protein [Caudoviricetes sp.]